MAGSRKADTIAEDLLERIVARDFAVGSVLPKEAELADHYDVARSVVREAIKLLEVHELAVLVVVGGGGHAAGPSVGVTVKTCAGSENGSSRT